MSKKMKIATAATAAALLLMLAATTVMSVVMLVNQNKVNQMIAVYTGQYEDPAQEDDVTIGAHYVIKSTTQISDAYKTGDTSKLNDRDKETLEMAKAVIGDIITDDMSDYEKEQAVYRFLTKGMKATTSILTVISDTSNDNDNPHDVLKNRTAVCVGYATTFRMFMQMMGIECMVVHNTTLGHSWDLVRLDDGWYHTDCYMDSDSSNFRNFNMDDSSCRQMGHEWNTGFFPSASGKKYNYVLTNSKEIKNINAIPKALMEALEQRDSCFSLSFKEPITAEDEPVAKFMVEQLESMVGGSTEKFYLSSMWRTNDVGAYVLCYYITYTDDSSELPQEQREKIESRISNVLNQYQFYDKWC